MCLPHLPGMGDRGYQTQATAFALDSLQSCGRAVVQLPTGSGKTRVALRVAQAWLRGRGRRVYLITPSEETISQTVIAARLLGLRPMIDAGHEQASRHAQFIISTYASAWRRHEKWIAKSTLLLLDECHHVNFAAPVNADILDRFDYGVGLSATPWSKGCMAYFRKNIFIYSLSRAIADGVNAQYEIKPWTEPVNGSYQIVYTNRQDVRESLKRIMQSCDYAIYSQPRARDIISRFRTGAIKTIVVNRMLTEGFDLPAIKRIWIARDTKSRIAAMQMAGRALRAHKSRTAELFISSAQTRVLLDEALKRAG